MVMGSKVVSSFGLVMIVLFCLSILALPVDVEAKVKIVAIDGVGYNVNSSLQDNVKSFIGKRVSVTLNSGKTFTGIVKKVGNHLVHLEKLEGKEYYDALIRIENISAIDTRFRDISR